MGHWDHAIAIDVQLHKSLSVSHGPSAIELLSLPHRKRSPSISLFSIAEGPFFIFLAGMVFIEGTAYGKGKKKDI